MNEKYLLNKEKALNILLFDQHAVSMEALGLIVILVKMNCTITFDSWMEEFGGGWNGWNKRLFTELLSKDILERLSYGDD